LANLKENTPEDIYQVLADLEWPPEPPSDAELAKRYGNAEGRKVFVGMWDFRDGLYHVRQKWLEAWRADNNISWLPFPW
jgi:hypothetical protein